jgi:Putative amidoligase enzyme
MEALKQYRTSVKTLEGHKQKLNEDFNKASTLFSQGLAEVDENLRKTHAELDNLLLTEAEKVYLLPNREKIILLGLCKRDKKAAVDWLKTKFNLTQQSNYSATVKRVKKAIGYSIKEGVDFKDVTLEKHDKFKKLMQELYLTSVAKNPRSEAEHIGVEIECFVPNVAKIRDDFQTYCITNRVKGAQIKSDASISPDSDHIGIEITVLVRKDDLRDLVKVCQWLKLKKAKVNKSCGLHVHLDFRTKTNIDTAGTRLESALPYLASLVPSTRRANDRYCRLAKNSVGSSDRYVAINLSAYSKFKTLEVRLHSGTCNFTKITSWVTILDNIINNTNFDKKQTDQSIDKFIQLLDFKNDAINYYIYERYKKFNGEKSVSEERGEE